jgi:hypothetical protein
MHCSPNTAPTTDYTCFDTSELEEIALALNIYITKNKALSNYCHKQSEKCILRKTIDIQNKSKKGLWKSINKRLGQLCNQESCWIDLDLINMIPDKYVVEKIKYFTFKPKMSKNRRSWLSTRNINEVMQQYQEFDKSFKFLGALPSNFYTQIRVDYSQFKHYKKVGIVFNLDTHDKPGSHWVAFLIDNKNRQYEYFDSTGKSPNKHIKTFINMLIKQEIIKSYRYLQNTTVHQTKNSECGIYSMFYIIQRLLGKDFHTIVDHVIRDDDMNKFRDHLFRPYH